MWGYDRFLQSYQCAALFWAGVIIGVVATVVVLSFGGVIYWAIF